LRLGGIFERSANTSVASGGIFLQHRATLRALGRFGQDERFGVRALVRYQRMSLLGPAVGAPVLIPPPDPNLMDPNMREPGETPPEQLHDFVHRWQGQLSFGARPWPRRMVEVVLSYRFTAQTGAVLGVRRFRQMERNLLFVSLAVGLPTRLQEGARSP
jgi:hypothetical protein